MFRSVLCPLLLVAFGLGTVFVAGTARAEDPVLFVSAFAPGPKGAIHAFRFDTARGALTPLERTGDVEHPFFLALSPDGKFLYSIHAKSFGGKDPEQVAAYRIADRTGKLVLLNRQSTKGTASCFLDVDATGRTVLVANYSTGNVAALPIKEDGSLGEAASFVQHVGSSVNPQRQKGPYAHCLLVGPDNRFAYAADLGIDQVLIYKLDPARALLTPAPQAFVRTPPGAGPRHLTFHPNGRHLYVVNELANSVTRFDVLGPDAFLAERETISTLPDDFKETTHCADVKVTPDGRFLYATNRGHDSLAVFRLGEDGRLSRTAIVPSGGQGPQNLLISPAGDLLVCANMRGNNVVVFRLDQTTGTPQPLGEPLELPSPSCLRLMK